MPITFEIIHISKKLENKQTRINYEGKCGVLIFDECDVNVLDRKALFKETLASKFWKEDCFPLPMIDYVQGNNSAKLYIFPVVNLSLVETVALVLERLPPALRIPPTLIDNIKEKCLRHPSFYDLDSQNSLSQSSTPPMDTYMEEAKECKENLDLSTSQPFWGRGEEDAEQEQCANKPSVEDFLPQTMNRATSRLTPYFSPSTSAATPASVSLPTLRI